MGAPTNIPQSDLEPRAICSVFFTRPARRAIKERGGEEGRRSGELRSVGWVEPSGLASASPRTGSAIPIIGAADRNDGFRFRSTHPTRLGTRRFYHRLPFVHFRLVMG